MFTRKTISSMPRRRMYFFRYMTMFFLGASAVMLATYASGTLDISTSLSNAVQYIQQIVLTSDGGNSGSSVTGIVLDGSGGLLHISNTLVVGNTGWDNPVCGNANVCGVSMYSRDFFSNHGDFSIINGDFGIGYDVGNSSSGNNLYVSGNLGVGTNSPTEKFQVGNYAWIGNNTNMITGGNFLRILSNDVYVYEPNIQLNAKWQDDPGQPIHYENWKIKNDQAMQFQYATGNYNYSSKMTIKGNGNVGIGTSNPGSKLEVNGTGVFMGIGIGTNTPNNALEIANSNSSLGFNANAGLPRILLNSNKSTQVGFSIMQYFTAGYLFNQDGGIAIQAGGELGDLPNTVYISSTGQVGIGTTTPSTKLDVQGGIRIGGERVSAYKVFIESPGSPDNNHFGITDRCTCDTNPNSHDCGSYVSATGAAGCYDEDGAFSFYNYGTLHSSYGCNIPGGIVYEDGHFFGCEDAASYGTPSNVFLWKQF